MLLKEIMEAHVAILDREMKGVFEFVFNVMRYVMQYLRPVWTPDKTGETHYQSDIGSPFLMRHVTSISIRVYHPRCSFSAVEHDGRQW